MPTRVALLIASIVMMSGPLNATDKLTLRVSPAISMAPAEVVVTATVERDADNRSLEIAAESPDFFRSSVITLEGDQAPRTTQLHLKNLPGGDYVVVVVLRGSHGDRALERRSLVVMPTAGGR
jgi:hypothetical protein